MQTNINFIIDNRLIYRAMETDVSQDFQDYWNEYRIVTSDEKLCEDDNLQSQSKSDDEGLDEAEWLVLAGLSHLTDSYLRGQEIEETELEPVMNVLSLHQANAVRRRVHSLNQTIKHRPRAKHKKPDIRDVFKNVEVSQRYLSHNIVATVIILLILLKCIIVRSTMNSHCTSFHWRNFQENCSLHFS